MTRAHPHVPVSLGCLTHPNKHVGGSWFCGLAVWAPFSGVVMGLSVLTRVSPVSYQVGRGPPEWDGLWVGDVHHCRVVRHDVQSSCSQAPGGHPVILTAFSW